MKTIDEMIEDIDKERKHLDREAIVMKAVLVVFIVLMVAVIVGAIVGAATGCSPKDTNQTINEEVSISDTALFELVDNGPDFNPKGDGFFAVYRNVVTNTMFARYRYKQSVSLCEMSNPKTGYPLTYEDYLQMKEDKEIK